MVLATDGSCAVHGCVRVPDGHLVCDFMCKWLQDAQSLLAQVAKDGGKYKDQAAELAGRDIAI